MALDLLKQVMESMKAGLLERYFNQLKKFVRWVRQEAAEVAGGISLRDQPE